MGKSLRPGLISAAVLLIASAVPNLGVEVNTFGFYWNFYRMAVVLLAIFTLFMFRAEIKLTGRKSFLIWMGFLAGWFIYGAALFVLSPYADSYRGLQELLSVMLGLLSAYILSNLRLNRDEVEKLLRVFFVILAALLVLGFWEMITGNHLSTSMFADPNNSKAKLINPKSVAGIMYNINDFSALITLMAPVVIGRFRIRFRRFYLDPGWLLVAGVVLINRVNEANTCNIAVIFAIMLYIFLQISGNRRSMGRLAFVGLLAIAAFLILYSIMDGKDGGLISRMMGLVKDSTEGMGSLHSRLLIYRDAISVGWLSGFIGLGPAGFPVYFTMHPSDSWFVNPHSLIMEIFSQYGLLITAAFLIIMAYLIRRSFRLFKEAENEHHMEWGRMGVIFISTYLIVSFASSSYLLNTFHWTLIGMICLMLETAKEEREQEAVQEINWERERAV